MSAATSLLQSLRTASATMLRRPLHDVQLRSYSGPSAKGHVNFFAGLPINRLAWLRSSPAFLNAVAALPATRWILFSEGKPLMQTATGPGTPGALARLTTADVRGLLGPEPYFAQGERPGDAAPEGVRELEAARLHGPPVVFLGLHEHGDAQHALPSSDFSAKHGAATAVAEKIRGTPYFSLDVSDVETERVDEVVASAQGQGGKLEFLDGRAAMNIFNQFDSGVFSEARSLVDWTARNKFCAGCGSEVYTLWAGWKHGCSSLLPWKDNSALKKPCPTAKALNNYLHPRTDPVVIILTVSPDNTQILLGRNRNWPKNFYSALAGFVEPGESLEDTVERELWEEAGIKMLGLKYHSTQPWPFPANVMAGFYAVADPAEPVRTDLDNELEDARWYTREQVLAVLAGTAGKPTEAPKWDSAAEETNASQATEPKSPDEPPFKGPPPNAMAGVLIREWAEGKVDIGMR